MIYFIMALTASLVCASGRAEVPSAPHERAFLRTGQGAIPFGEAERVARYHDVGEYRGGELRLAQFVFLGDGAYLGLDERRRLMQVIDLPERTVAYPLGGDRPIRDFFLLEDGPLIALDHSGELFVFDRARWEKSPRDGIIAHQALRYVDMLAVLGLVAGLIDHFKWLGVTHDEIVMATAYTAGLTALLPVFRTLMIYSEDNQVPDGLRPLGRRVDDLTRVEQTHPDRFGRGGDVRLVGRNETLSLRRVIREAGLENATGELFDRACAKDLAVGVAYPSPLPTDYE